jgi:hypothetical protein
MGNRNSYFRLNNNKGIVCIVYTESINQNEFAHDNNRVITKYYLPNRNIGFYFYENLFYIYTIEINISKMKDSNQKYISKKLYNLIIEMYKISELKKIKSMYIITELKKLNNYDSFNITV